MLHALSNNQPITVGLDSLVKLIHGKDEILFFTCRQYYLTQSSPHYVQTVDSIMRPSIYQPANSNSITHRYRQIQFLAHLSKIELPVL
jgi:hypothetical protein